jgi:endoglucanase
MRGISGFEYRMNKKIADLFLPYCDEVRIDRLGSVIAVKHCGKPDAPKIMIEAHCDEIGLMVTSISNEGYLTFANVGGVDQRILPALEVVVHAKRDLPAVIGIMPDKYIEDGKTVKMSDMAIDTGLPAKEVKKLVSVGDSVTIAQSVGELGKKQWSGKSLDDRASVAALINVMCRLSEKQLNADVYAVAAVQEEVGCRGGKTTAGGIRPDIAIAIDVTHGITPDNSDNAFEVGSGTAISVGPNIHPLLADALFRTADTHNIKYTIEACGGETGTDAWEIQPSRGGGVPTALLSIPLKYMHTSVETLAVSDVKATAKLLAAFIEEFTDLNAFDFAKEVLK